MYQVAIQIDEYKMDIKVHATYCNRTDICRSDSAFEVDNKPGKH